jgi:hypothetical protein
VPPASQPGEERLDLVGGQRLGVPCEIVDRLADPRPIERARTWANGSVRQSCFDQHFPCRCHVAYRTTVELDRNRLQQVVEAVAERLAGDWLLIGGALAALWLEPRRTTEDVDIVGLVGTIDERLALMRLAAELGLPVEALNSAADFFVRRIDGWRDELELFRAGTKGRIYRPTVTLFLLLKLERLTEHDLADCLAAVARARAERLRFDPGRVLAALDALPPAGAPDLGERRQRLREAVAAAGR